MSKSINLIGQKFERLTVIKRIEDKNCKDSKWLCECDCGNEIIALWDRLKKIKEFSENYLTKIYYYDIISA